MTTACAAVNAATDESLFQRENICAVNYLSTVLTLQEVVRFKRYSCLMALPFLPGNIFDKNVSVDTNMLSSHLHLDSRDSRSCLQCGWFPVAIKPSGETGAEFC